MTGWQVCQAFATIKLVFHVGLNLVRLPSTAARIIMLLVQAYAGAA